MSEPTDAPQKLAKLMARAGYASRREAERLIKAGKVRVEGKIIDNVAERFPASVSITVIGQSVKTITPARLYRYHKPRGLVTSHHDDQGRDNVFQHLPKNLPRLVSVGRLDMDSEGLLLLTNDGALAGKLEKSNLPRIYRVRMQGSPSEAQLAELAEGVMIDGIFYAPIIVKPERKNSTNSWYSVTLREGKNREIRKVFAHLGCRVNRLIRTGFGGISLETLAAGNAEILDKKQLQALLSRI